MVAAAPFIPTYAEFFAGGGMVSAALAGGWNCVLANDIDPMKCAAYSANFPDHPMIPGDIRDLARDALDQAVDLYWASSPCQDFSLAGKGAGLSGARSGTFRAWIDTLRHAVDTGNAPRLIAFENVTGLISRNAGADFALVLRDMMNCGYRVGAVEVDTAQFLPQSRPRVFVVGVRRDVQIPSGLLSTGPTHAHAGRVRKFMSGADAGLRRNWLWWALPDNTAPLADIATLLQPAADVDWFTQPAVDRLLSLMSDSHLALTQAICAGDADRIGFIYKRGRPDADGIVRQRAEVRFDGVAGCIRTPAGGSSKQIVLLAGRDRLRARHLTAREAVRLMGLPDTYALPPRVNAGYKIAGDGVAVPIVAHLDHHIFRPILRAARAKAAAA